MMITWEVGEKVLKPVEFRLREKVTPRWWWRDKIEYWIETDLASVGPIATRAEALAYLAIAQRS